MPLGYCFQCKSLQQITVLSPSQGALRTYCCSDVLLACLSGATLTEVKEAIPVHMLLDYQALEWAPRVPLGALTTLLGSQRV